MVVGTGITGIGQTTLETVACLERAEKVFFLVTEPRQLLLRLIVTEPAAQKAVVALSEGRGKLVGCQGPAGCCHCVTPCAPVLVAGIGERPVEVPQDGARETCWRFGHRAAECEAKKGTAARP